MKIAIDCGHNCPPDTGAISAYASEDILTREVGDLVIQKLHCLKYQLVDVTPLSCSSVNDSLNQRCAKANQERADLFVSIHFNSFDDPAANGSEVFYASDRGKAIAAKIQAELVGLGFKDRGIKKDELFVLKNTQMPAVLVECCFVSSPEDMGRCDSEAMATAIVKGLTGQAAPVKTPKDVILEATENTWLKQSEEQSSVLADKDKCRIEKGQQLEVLSWEDEGSHLKLQLRSPLKNRCQWYAFESHVRLLKAGKPLEFSPADSGPSSDRTAPPDEEMEPVKGKGKALRLPSGKTVYTGDSIITGGHFSWGEATHNGTRIPQNTTHEKNIIALAKRLEEVRERLGGVPLKVTSWYRPEPWNRRAGGARQSKHLTGGAVDLLRPKMSGRQMAQRLSDWSGGMGIYGHFPNLLHLDIRPYRARWGGA